VVGVLGFRTGDWSIPVREIVSIIGVLFLFAAVHSTCATDRVKHWNAAWFGAVFVRRYFRFLYMIVSLVTTAAVFGYIYLLPDRTLLRLPDTLAYACRLVQLGGLVFILSSFEVVNFREFSGFTQVTRGSSEQDPDTDIEGIRSAPIERRGPYALMRHPMYAGALVVLLFSPEFSRNWIVVRGLAILYMYYGTRIEERRLLERYGEEYRAYMRDVPRFIPRLKRRKSKGT